ncbi:MAG: hypothetical protein PHF70_08125 [Opitutales bacterium]|nr:hypothetical protein [Opitutales bacterium]
MNDDTSINKRKDPSELRTKWIKFRISKNEEAQIRNRIPANSSLSDYIREEILKMPATGWSPVKSDIAPEVVESIREISKLTVATNCIGENVNQIARSVNTLAKSNSTISAGLYLKELNAIFKEIKAIREIADDLKGRL